MKRSDIPDEEILAACDRRRLHKGRTPDIELAHKYPVKVILSKMRHLHDRGLINYGVSLRTAWTMRWERGEVE